MGDLLMLRKLSTQQKSIISTSDGNFSPFVPFQCRLLLIQYPHMGSAVTPVIVTRWEESCCHLHYHLSLKLSIQLCPLSVEHVVPDLSCTVGHRCHTFSHGIREICSIHVLPHLIFNATQFFGGLFFVGLVC